MVFAAREEEFHPLTLGSCVHKNGEAEEHAECGPLDERDCDHFSVEVQMIVRRAAHRMVAVDDDDV